MQEDSTFTAAFISNAPLPSVNSAEYLRLISSTFEAISEAKSRGIKGFISDATRGFNLIAPLLVLLHKVVSPEIKLCLQLPSANRIASWSSQQRKCFDYISKHSHECTYLLETYENGCITANNRSIIDRSSLIIAYVKYGNYKFDALSYAKKTNKDILFVTYES